MKSLYMCAVSAWLMLAVGNAMAAAASVTILAPADGATLDVMEQNMVDYAWSHGPGSDHVHLYVDGKEVAILRALEGSYPLENLSPGKHDLCIKVVNKNHTPIGVEKCVAVMAE